jgi:ATP-dependent exoDNAse (exonuclease V) alpha subunit
MPEDTTIINKQSNISDIDLSSEQQELFERIEETGSNMFITGKAGTGKSVLLQYFKENTMKQAVVVAPTGVAALNVRGQTIHSFFKIKPGFIRPEELNLTSKTALLLRNVDTIIIDEISMVRADLMDGIDHLLRMARSNNDPFGGAQIVMFGDLYQLPPIVDSQGLQQYFAHNHGGYYFFNAHVWENADLEVYELGKIFRQKDELFKDILNSIRLGEVTSEHLELLNNRVDLSVPKDGIITLVTTNNLVREINMRRLADLDESSTDYIADIDGELEESAFPTEEVLILKKGAQVMFLKNDREKRWVNGTLGIIDSLSDLEIKVNIDGIIYSVQKETWTKIRYHYDIKTRKVKEEVVSSFTQFPLRLAWAITIHKSQGQTYKLVAINLGGGAFAHGQTYVALSRCKSLEGIYLKKRILVQDIIVDPVVVNFMQKVQILRN